MATTTAAVVWWGSEEAIRLSCVPRFVPARANGKPVSVDAVYLWTTRGVRGVRLRRFKFGGQWFTTKQELARWQAALTVSQ